MLANNMAAMQRKDFLLIDGMNNYSESSQPFPT